MLEVYQYQVKMSSVFDMNLGDKQCDKAKVIKRHYGDICPFQTITMPWTQAALDDATARNCLVSQHVWQDGKRHGSNWQKSQILFFDFDNKDSDIPIDEQVILRRLEACHWANGQVTCYIHHSQSSNPAGGHPKLHVFLLLDRVVEDGAEYGLIYNFLREQIFPESDNVGDLARCIIPGRSDIPSTFVEGEPLSAERLLDVAYLETMRKQAENLANSLQKVERVNSRPGAKGKAVYLSVDTVVQLEDGDYVTLRELDPNHKPQFLCPYCGHRAGRGNPGRANATYQLNSQGRPIVYCSSCDALDAGGTSLMGVYNIQPDQEYSVVREELREKYRGFFYLEEKLARVYIQTDVEPYSISVGTTPILAIDEDPLIKHSLMTELAKEARGRKNFVVNQEGDMECDAPSFEWRGDKLIAMNPALKSKVEDNKFIEDWLTSLFGIYTEFMKQWLALYCYTNYMPLPVLILYSKQRGTGKNVFAEAVCQIFEPLHSRDTDYKNFTEAFQGKMWYLDEQSTDGKALYDVIKQIGGNSKLMVNNKYGLKHHVDRNLSVIITTNNLRPMEMESDELQVDESNNQFFVMEMKSIPATKRQTDIATQIHDRLGHYARTELRGVYEKIQQDPKHKQYRYGINVPVTPWEERLYKLSRSALEHESNEIWDRIRAEAQTALELKTNLFESTIRVVAGQAYVMPSVLRRLVKDLGCESPANKVRDYLQQKGHLGLDVERKDDKRLGYLVHP